MARWLAWCRRRQTRSCNAVRIPPRWRSSPPQAGGEIHLGQLVEFGTATLQGRTHLSPFAIDRTEVTVAAYQACMSAGSCAEPAAGTHTFTIGTRDPERLPINGVSRSQAAAY